MAEQRQRAVRHERQAGNSGRRDLLALLQAHNVRLNHALGQNFLYDQQLLAELVALAGVERSDWVVEVGSGAGSLTQPLADCAAEGLVITCEVDTSLQPLLSARFAAQKNVRLIFNDALKLDFAALVREPHTALRVVANLPYYITTELISKFILELPEARSMAFMVQAEATERIVAQVGQGRSKAYGPLAVLVQLYGSAKVVKEIPRHVFVPEPHVDSSFILLEKIEPQAGDLRAQVLSQVAAFARFVQAAFRQRRKTLINNLSVYAGQHTAAFKEKLGQLGLASNVRAEALSWQELGELFLLSL